MDVTPWLQHAIKLLHQGYLKDAEMYLLHPPAGTMRGPRDVVLLDVLLALGKKNDAHALYERLLWSAWVDTVPSVQLDLQKYTEHFLLTWRPMVHVLRPHDPVPDGTTMVGASVITSPQGLHILVRGLNVTYDGNTRTGGISDRWKRCINTLYWFELDTSLRTLQYTPVVDRAVFPRSNDEVIGYDDPRIFQWNDAIWMTATSYQVYNSRKAHMMLCRLDPSAGAVLSAVPLQCPDMNEPQHDWAPWVHNGAVHFVYAVQPWTVLKLEDAATGATNVVVRRTLPVWVRRPRAILQATSPVPYGDGYLMVLGFKDPVITHEERVLYRYLKLSSDLIPTAVSSTWVLWQPELEVIQGLAIDSVYVYLTYGHCLSECRVTRFIRQLLETALTWTPISVKRNPP